MRIVSWNVNGIRSAIRKGFWDWLQASGADIVCLQETRIQPDQLSSSMRRPPGYKSYWHSAGRKGYSGVATFCRQDPSLVAHGIGEAKYDLEGRVLITQYSAFTLINAYFPSGRRSLERVEYKLEFYEALLGACLDLRSQGHRLVVCGDYNTAHQPIDLARPGQNKKTSGFLPEERVALTRWLDAGFRDVFRDQHPDAEEYTWWTYRYDARSRNIGWRIDYFLVASELLPCVQEVRILSHVLGSDHCPIELELEI